MISIKGDVAYEVEVSVALPVAVTVIGWLAVKEDTFLPAVACPFALIVTLLNVPALLFTAGSVVVIVPVPVSEISPLNAIVRFK